MCISIYWLNIKIKRIFSQLHTHYKNNIESIIYYQFIVIYSLFYNHFYFIYFCISIIIDY